MAVERVFQVPINLNLNELRNAVLQNLSSTPAAKLGRIFYQTSLDTAGHMNAAGTFIPWDATKATNIPNAALANASVTIGTTAVALGASVTTLAGLTSVTSGTFVGALTGNASTATKLAATVTIGFSGVTATSQAFDGSGNITIPITAIPASLLTGSLPSTQLPAFTGDVTTAVGTSVTTIAPNAVTFAKMATQAASTLTGNPTTSTANPTAITLNAVFAFASGALTIAAGGITNAMLANSSVTIGSTAVPLGGASVTTLAGLTSVTSTSFVGALTGNASTATKFAATVTIGLSGVTATAQAFDGSGNITIPVTAVPTTVLTGVLLAAQHPALTGDVTNTAGTVATTISNGAVTFAKMANVAASSLIGNATGSAAVATAITLSSALAFSSGALTIAAGGVTNAMLANPNVVLGSTTIAQGATVTTVAGLVSVTSTTFVGALTGNASTATKLATAVTIALSGGVTGTATPFDGSGNITIPVTAVAASSITGTFSSSHISDLASTVQGYSISSFAAATANINMNGYLINGLAPGVAGTDAVNVNQLSALTANSAAGLTPKDAVRVTTTGTNLATLAGLLTIDGVTLAAGDRVLVKDQTTASQNGIYVAASGAWARSYDGIQGDLVTGSMMLVTAGTLWTGSQWWLTTSGTITIGTTALTFSQYGSNDSVTYGNGLTRVGLNVTVQPTTGIVVTGAGVGVDTTLVVRKAVATIGDGTSTAFAITHNLGSTAITVAALNLSTLALEELAIVITSSNVVTVSFGAAPASNSYQITIHG
jgi:hypothetical protein